MMLYRFALELSDIDRGIYESLDFRVAQHPSETAPYLLSRVLAFAMSYQEGLEFTPQGLGDPESPALWAKGVHGSIDLWIEIGNPSAKKLHKAGKTAKQVVVYTYKNPDMLMEQIRSNDVYRGDEVKIFSFGTKFIESLEGFLEKNNRWSILIQQGRLDVNTGSAVASSEITQH